MVSAQSNFINPGIRIMTGPTTDDPFYVGTSAGLPPAPSIVRFEADVRDGSLRGTVRGTADRVIHDADGRIHLQNAWVQNVNWRMAHDDWAIATTATSALDLVILRTTNAVTNTSAWLQHTWKLDAAGVWGGPTKGYKPPVRLLNHRGVPMRSENKSAQWSNVQPEELVALQLLRKMVSPDEFKRYLKHGFVNVRGPSGLTYQIGRYETIKVWDDGELIATLCVHLNDWYNKPPTDEVVAKLLLAELDEPDLYRRANVTFRTTKRDRPRLLLVGVAA